MLGAAEGALLWMQFGQWTDQGCVWTELGLQEDPCAPGGREAVLPWPLEALLLPLVLLGDGLRQ